MHHSVLSPDQRHSLFDLRDLFFADSLLGRSLTGFGLAVHPAIAAEIQIQLNSAKSDKQPEAQDGGSIIPDPGPAPDVEPTTGFEELREGTRTIAADEVIFVRERNEYFFIEEEGARLVNNGTLWLEDDRIEGERPVVVEYRVLSWNPSRHDNIEIENNGLIHVFSQGQAGVLAGGLDGRLVIENTGSIFALSQIGSATIVDAESAALVENSGLLATRVEEVDTVSTGSGIAITINAQSGRSQNQVINHIGGQILAEAPLLAVAISMVGNGGGGRPGSENDGPLVDNAGLIEAHATSDGGISIGIEVRSASGLGSTIVNSGTIRADTAILGGRFLSAVQNPIERVVNEATGVIEGAIFLGAGEDIIQNDGLIVGPVQMGLDDDHFFGSGQVDGFVDLGWGDDLFEGSAFGDRVTGGFRGNDTLFGGGGDDILLGGGGDDFLQGDAGNDGLFGEWGNDRIATLGGDYADGGNGDDRIELGDYTFEAVDGGAGFDFLALADGARSFSLAAMVENGRVQNVEAIEMQGNQELSIDAGSIAAFTGGLNILWIDGSSTDAVHLQGVWASEGQFEFQGVSFQVWRQGEFRVYATLDTMVFNNSASDFGGFDAVAAGDNAPRPETDSAIDPTNTTFLVTGLDPRYDGPNGQFVVAAEETILSPLPGTTIVSFSSGVVVNNGTVAALSNAGEAAALGLPNAEDIINNGLILAEASDDAFFTNDFLATVGIGANFAVDNRGEIGVYSEFGNAIGITQSGRTINTGLISVVADNLQAIGLSGAVGWDQFSPFDPEARYFINAGVIYARGNGTNDLFFIEPGEELGSVTETAAAIGVAGIRTIFNDGSIVAELGSNAGPDDYSVGVFTGGSSDGTPTGVINTGTIEGTYAIAFQRIIGAQYYVDNAGLIVGDVAFARGDDTYNNADGETRGTVFGFEGDDVFITGAFNDDLDGGADFDIAVFAGNFANFDVREGDVGAFTITGTGTDSVVGIEVLRFDDVDVLLDLGQGLAIDPGSDNPDTFMVNIRDFDGNDLGGAASWVMIGEADANLDGSIDYIFVNREIGRFAEVGVDGNGLAQFDNHGQGGDTRVVGIYIDPLVESGEVEQGSDFDSQRRFQNDLFIGNIARVLGSQDYDGDGFAEIYFALTDGTAYLRALMHADGNIQYANYQSEEQVIEYLNSNGFGEETYGDWFGAATAQEEGETTTFVNEAPTTAKDQSESTTSDLIAIKPVIDPVESDFGGPSS